MKQYPHPESSQERYKPRILKCSEMALYLDGDIVSEIENPSYGNRADFCYWDPVEKRVLFHAIGHGDKLIELGGDDLLKLKEDVGHVPLALALHGHEDHAISDAQFQHEVVYALSHQVQGCIQKIGLLAKALGYSFDASTLDYCIKRVAASHPTYSPQDLWGEIFLSLEEKMRFEEGRAEALYQMMRQLIATGVLTMDQEASKRGIVAFVSLWLRVQGIDQSSPRILAKYLWEHLPSSYHPQQDLYGQLLDEYRRSPDTRFSDALLVAVSHLEDLRKEGSGEYEELG